MRSTVLTTRCLTARGGGRPNAARLGTDFACHLPSKERLPRSNMSGKEQTDSGSMLLSPWKTNVQHYSVCLAKTTPKFLKMAKKLQLSCPWKLSGFMQKTHHMLPRKSKAYSLSKPEFCNTNPETSYLLRNQNNTLSFLSKKLVILPRKYKCYTLSKIQSTC